LDSKVSSFYRRLSFSPDGTFLLTPCGQALIENSPEPAAHLFHRKNLTRFEGVYRYDI